MVRQSDVYDYLTNHPNSIARDIAEGLGATTHRMSGAMSQVYKCCHKLEQYSYIIRDESDGRTRWSVVEDDQLSRAAANLTILELMLNDQM